MMWNLLENKQIATEKKKIKHKQLISLFLFRPDHGPAPKLIQSFGPQAVVSSTSLFFFFCLYITPWIQCKMKSHWVHKYLNMSPWSPWIDSQQIRRIDIYFIIVFQGAGLAWGGCVGFSMEATERTGK